MKGDICFMKKKQNERCLSESDLIVTREEKLALARQLTLMSDIFMSVALKDKRACQHVLRIILNCPDLVVQSVRTQYELSKLVSHDAKLDVLASDSKKRLYHIEIQRRDVVDHARRTRFYSAMVDSEFLEKGGSYKDMPELHIIYISETDIWKAGKTVYHVKKVLDDTGISYDDGLHVHYINAAIDDGSETAKLMRYFKTTDPYDESQGDLSKRVKLLKSGEGSEKNMCEAADLLMQLGEQIGEARGEARGAERAEERMTALIQKLTQEQRYEDLARSAREPEYRKQLYQEFGLE